MLRDCSPHLPGKDVLGTTHQNKVKLCCDSGRRQGRPGRPASLPGFIASAALCTLQVPTSSRNCRHDPAGTCCLLPHRRHSSPELWLGRLTVVFAKVGAMFPQIIIFVRGSVFCHPDVTAAIHFTPTFEGQTPRSQSAGSLHVPTVWSRRLRGHRRQTAAQSPWTQS